VRATATSGAVARVRQAEVELARAGEARAPAGLEREGELRRQSSELGGEDPPQPGVRRRVERPVAGEVEGVGGARTPPGEQRAVLRPLRPHREDVHHDQVGAHRASGARTLATTSGRPALRACTKK
jgi:hypothetical protein